VKVADQPFQFFIASYIPRISNQKAKNLAELRDGLASCSDACVFYHTFQSLGRHHFLTEGFSDDFAHWVLAALNQAALAEQLAGLDIRDYLSIAELRGDLRRLVAEYCEGHPTEALQIAFEPFHFCDTIEVAVPLGREARTLEEFRRELERLSHDSLYFHFIASRLRLQLRTNDFSFWLANALGLTALAERANRIDIYANTLDSAQAQLLALVDSELVPYPQPSTTR
jgi:hypothetical protein